MRNTCVVIALAGSLLAAGYADMTLYLDAAAGNDSWDGTAANHVAGTNHGPWRTIGRGKAGMRTELTSADGSGTLALKLASGMYELESALTLGAPDSPPSASSGYDSVVWQGPGGATPWCRASHVPGNFSAECTEPTQADTAVLSAGSQITWTVATAAETKAAVAGMDASAPAVGPAGIAAAQAAGTLFVGKWASASQPQASPPSQIYDGTGRPRVRARWPQPGTYAVWEAPLCNSSLHVTNPCTEHARYGFQFANGSVLTSYTDANATRFQVYHGWTASSHALKEVLPGNRTVLFVNPSDRPIGYWPNHDSEGGGRFFIEAIEYLTADAAGQWAWSGALQGALYVARAGENPAESQHPWSASRLQTALNFTAGAHDLTVQGLSVRHVQWDCMAADGMECDQQSTNWQGHAAIVAAAGATRVVVDSCEVAGSASYALWARSYSSNIVFSRNYLRDLGAGGIRVGEDGKMRNESLARQVTVSDNVVRRGGLDFPSGTGILVQMATNCSISHNEVGYLAYAGISVGWSWDFAMPSGTDTIEVAGNYIHNLGTGLFRQLGDAMAAIYTLGVQPGTVISGNFGHDVYASYTGGYGLSQDQGSSHMVFENNVLYRINAALQTQHYGINNTYRNNLFADGMVDSSTLLNSPALRTVPKAGMPNSFAFERNVVAWYNASNDALAFNGEYMVTPSSGEAAPGQSSAWDYAFSSNLYFDAQDPQAQSKAIWGGCVHACSGKDPFKLTWAQWTGGCGTDKDSSPSSCTGPKQDAGSRFGDPLIADAAAFNFTLLPSSPALAIGFEQIDLSQVGIRAA